MRGIAPFAHYVQHNITRDVLGVHACMHYHMITSLRMLLHTLFPLCTGYNMEYHGYHVILLFASAN